jgi:hypothetical protein
MDMLLSRISKSNIDAVSASIQNQREHHQRRTFQEEYLEFLVKNGIPINDRYVWG